MSKRDISSFFKPVTKKSKTTALTQDEAGLAPKKAETQQTDSADPEVPIDAISPAARAEANRAAALAKIEAKKQTCVPEGGSSYLPTLPEAWADALGPETTKPYWRQLEAFLSSEVSKGKSVYPPRSEIFTALELCPLDQVRVVIIGQDPYHGTGQGHGLSFSVKHGIATPPSLRNMVKEAMSCEGISKPSHGNLTKWARQGVLLLNNVLTVEKGKADSHKGRGWERFTDAVVKAVNARGAAGFDGVVFLLWGKPAHAKGAGVDRSKHRVICTSHPSPLGATKTNAPFAGSACFKKANDYLESKGKPKIDWNL